MNGEQVDLSNWIKDGFDLYKNNFGILLITTLIGAILASVTFGILAGPMSAGILLITLALHDKKEPKPEIGDLFKGFGFFLQSFLLIIVWGIIIFVASVIVGILPLIGFLASLCVQLAANALLMFSLFLIVEKQMDFWPASMESINMVKTNFWPFLALSVIAGVLGSIGILLLGIGIVFTLPIYFCIITVAYRKVF